MFPESIVRNLTQRHQDAFRQLKSVEKALTGRLWNMGDAVHALVLAVASGQPLLFIGPPGTAKSRLVRDFCTLIGLVDEQNPADRRNGEYFEYLLTPFTEPGELFGFYDIQRFIKGNGPQGGLQRLGEGRMLQHARVAFLDEVFNASSAILNSILAIMNERLFHDRGEVLKVSLQCLFGATNRVPESPELEALFDRFVLRCHVDNVPAVPSEIGELVRKGWVETYRTNAPLPNARGLLGDLAKFQADVRERTGQGQEGGLAPDTGAVEFQRLTQMVDLARDYRLSAMSNRRLIQLSYVMLVNRIYRAATTDGRGGGDLRIGRDELALLPTYFLDRRERAVIDKMERYLPDST